MFAFLESGFYKDCKYWVTLTQIFLKNDTFVSQVPGFYKDCEYWVTLTQIFLFFVDVVCLLELRLFHQTFILAQI